MCLTFACIQKAKNLAYNIIGKSHAVTQYASMKNNLRNADNLYCRLSFLFLLILMQSNSYKQLPCNNSNSDNGKRNIEKEMGCNSFKSGQLKSKKQNNPKQARHILLCC